MILLTPTTWQRALLKAAGKETPRHNPEKLYQGSSKLQRDTPSAKGRR